MDAAIDAGVESVDPTPKACPGDLPRACNRIWRYLELLGIEPGARGKITLDLLDRAMASTLAEGGHLTPAAMDALSAWLAERGGGMAPTACGGDITLLGDCAHPKPCRQPMAPEHRVGRGAWRRARQAGKQADKQASTAPNPPLDAPQP